MTQTAEQQQAIEQFNAAVQAKLPRNSVATFEQRQMAIDAAATSNPSLHRSYIQATNADKGKMVQRLIAEKYEA